MLTGRTLPPEQEPQLAVPVVVAEPAVAGLDQQHRAELGITLTGAARPDSTIVLLVVFQIRS
jgi:hypothetical protein